MKPMWWPHGTTLNRVFRMWVLNNVKIMMWKIVCLWLFGDRIGLVPVQVLACCRMCVEVLAKTRAWGLKLSHCLNGSGQVKLSVRQAKFWNVFLWVPQKNYRDTRVHSSNFFSADDILSKDRPSSWRLGPTRLPHSAWISEGHRVAMPTQYPADRLCQLNYGICRTDCEPRQDCVPHYVEKVPENIE